MNNTPIQVKKVSVMNKKEEVFHSLILACGFIITIFFSKWWFSQAHLPSNFSNIFHLFDIFLFAMLTFVVFYQVINEMFFWFVSIFIKHPEYIPPVKGMKVAFLTAFVPGKEPYDVLENSLSAMAKVDYPHDTWLLDEGDDNEAKRICKKYGVKHFSRFGIAKYNQESGLYKAKTKAGNYNAWFDNFGSEYEYVAQIDVDFIPKKDFLLKTLGYFRDPRVGFVGSPQYYGNTKESWIVQGASEQAYGFFGVVQKGLSYHDMSLFIGANHVVRVKAHQDIGGYSGHIVEDHLTGMNFYAKRWTSVYVPEILAIGEGPSTWGAYFSQQMRWAYGLFHILFTKSPKIFPSMRKTHIFHYFILQLYYFYGLAQVFAVILLTLYLTLGIQSTSMQLGEMVKYYLPLLIIQQLIFVWLQRFNIDPKKERGLMLRAKLLSFAVWPIYFLAFISVITGKRLSYAVTPKGNKQIENVNLSIFMPHFILGSMTLTGIIASLWTGHQAIQLVFFAWVNTAVLFFFIFNESLKKLFLNLEDINFSTIFSIQVTKLAKVTS